LARLRVGFKFSLLVLLTALAAWPPLLVWIVTFGARKPAARVGAVFSSLWGRACLWVIGVRTEVEGRPGDGVFLVTANHTSYLDIWVLASHYRSAFVAKREIAAWPLFGAIARSAGTLFVDRKSARDLLRASREMASHFRDGLSVTLFAEGKATNGAAVLPFMPSLLQAAAESDIPCYAASLSYETPDCDEPPSETVCWWGGHPLLPHVSRLLRLGRIDARLVISERPIRSSSRKELARGLHAEVERSFRPVRQKARGAEGPGDLRRDSTG
jgi:1-acyl-sn-glycerol-3-phosphate acyltransferase